MRGGAPRGFGGRHGFERSDKCGDEPCWQGVQCGCVNADGEGDGFCLREADEGLPLDAEMECAASILRRDVGKTHGGGKRWLIGEVGSFGDCPVGALERLSEVGEDVLDRRAEFLRESGHAGVDLRDRFTDHL